MKADNLAKKIEDNDGLRLNDIVTRVKKADICKLLSQKIRFLVERDVGKSSVHLVDIPK